MESELEQRLLNTHKEHLISLLQELSRHHPALHGEMTEILARLTSDTETGAPQDNKDDFNVDSLIMQRSAPQPIHLPLHREACLQRVASYSSRIQQDESPQAIFDDLIKLLQEAAARVEQHDYQQGLDIYAIVLDERLAIHHPVLSTIFDRAIDEFMSGLDMLLSEMSSTVMSHNSAPVSPLLPTEIRQSWLKRLFILWLKRMDVHRSEEHLPELLLEIVWSDDTILLRNLVQNEIQQQPTDEHSNIVDFSRQSRTRLLEKFLKELPLL